MEDFDAVGNVAVEFKTGKERVCIVGAELGNIEGIGRHRFPVSNTTEAKSSASGLHEYFKGTGLPFLRKYNDPIEIISALKNGGKEAMLISPFVNRHQEQISQLSSHYGVSM